MVVVSTRVKLAVIAELSNIDHAGEGQSCLFDNESCIWLLKYEAWYAECFDAYPQLLSRTARLKVAGNETANIVKHWVADVDGYTLAASGFNVNYGEYGVTWALFKLDTTA